MSGSYEPGVISGDMVTAVLMRIKKLPGGSRGEAGEKSPFLSSGGWKIHPRRCSRGDSRPAADPRKSPSQLLPLRSSELGASLSSRRVLRRPHFSQEELGFLKLT